MSQPEYNVTFFGTGNTSTNFTTIGSTGGVFLHTITVGSSGTGTVIFYKATSSSTGNEAIVLIGALGVPRTYIYDIQMPTLGRGQTTSTAELVVTWA